MDTYISITVVTQSEDVADQAIETAFTALKRFGQLIDFYSDNSELARINRNSGMKPVQVSPETFDVIQKALRVSENSNGAYDPTIGPIVKLWDFHKRKKPADRDIRDTLPLVNFRDVVIDRNTSTVFLRKKGMMLDLGGIAKGYAADLAVKKLKEGGIHSGLVAAAGDIRAFGLKPDGKPWKIGIQNPRQHRSTDELIATISLSERAISTSGDYQRYFMVHNERFHHLLDPKTGYPSHTCRSVSIVADRGVFADAYSTAVFIMGTDKGLELVKQERMEAVIIDKNGIMHTTQGLKGLIRIEERT